MKDDWNTRWADLTDWLTKVLTPDDPELGDINVPSMIEISNAPGGGLHGMAAVSIGVGGNASTSDIEQVLVERIETLLERYPAVNNVSLRLSPRTQSPEGGLGPCGEPYTLKLHRRILTTPSTDLVSRQQEEDYSQMGARPKLVGDLRRTPTEVLAWRTDPLLASQQTLVDSLIHHADRTAQQEGHMGSRLADYLEKTAHIHSEDVRAARQDMITMLTLASERQIALVREMATATATLTAERAAYSTAERTWEVAKAHLEERVSGLDEGLETERAEHMALVESTGEISRLSDGYKRRAILAERTNLELTARHTDLAERYNKLLKDRNKLRKAATGGDDSMGGMLTMFQQFMATQKGGESAEAVEAVVPVKQPEVEEEEEEVDPDAELLTRPPVVGVGAIRPVGSRPSARVVDRRPKTPAPAPATKPKPTAPKPAPAAAASGLDFGALTNATPDQVAAIFQMLPSKTVKGALNKLAENNPRFAQTVKSDLQEALGEEPEEEGEEEEEEGIEGLFDEDEEGDEGSEDEGDEGEEEEAEEDEEVEDEETGEEGEK